MKLYQRWLTLSRSKSYFHKDRPIDYLQTTNPTITRRKTTDIGAVTVRKNVLGWVTLEVNIYHYHTLIFLLTFGVKLSIGLIVLRAAMVLGIT